MKKEYIFIGLLLVLIVLVFKNEFDSNFFIKREHDLRTQYDSLEFKIRMLNDSIKILNIKYNELDEQYWDLIYAKSN